ncbi:MAG: phage virion morphogenesis protein [Proteobacteria bacterium]|nr:phage virion morphogenesis protein [Pseudomonadota bacterium]
MAAFTITVQDQAVQALLKRLAERATNMQPHLQAIGDDIVERAKRRFETSTGPDGAKWKPNTEATLGMLAGRLGKSYRKKSGDLNTKGERRIAGKKPLVGESGDLRRQIVAVATAGQVTVQATTAYSAMHQFGGTTSARSMIPGKTIPARPYLPVRDDGTLYPAESALILAAINEYLHGS